MPPASPSPSVRCLLLPLTALPYTKPGMVPLRELLAPGRTPPERLRVGEERLLQGRRSLRPAGWVPFEPERLQPTGLAESVEGEEPRLRELVGGLEDPRAPDRPQLPGAHLDPRLVARERLARYLAPAPARRPCQTDASTCTGDYRDLPGEHSLPLNPSPAVAYISRV